MERGSSLVCWPRVARCAAVAMRESRACARAVMGAAWWVRRNGGKGCGWDATLGEHLGTAPCAPLVRTKKRAQVRAHGYGEHKYACASRWGGCGTRARLSVQ
mmetsp:Transcript_985/g.2796  ORF Transcript_985/g.2796 Transcript_985/m.2796 type:complete len:102 (-) Transcript_985:270-575(-)